MKLKLEVQEGITILCVTEDLTPQHAPILKAGLTKLFQSGKKSVLLDLSAIAHPDVEALKELAYFQQTAPDFDSYLVIATPMIGMGQAKSREEAVKLMNSVLANLLATEAKLYSKLKKLDKQKTEITEKLAAVGTVDVEIRAMKKENSELKGRIKEMETRVMQLLDARTETLKADPLNAEKAETLNKTLVAVLEQEGMLPVT